MLLCLKYKQEYSDSLGSSVLHQIIQTDYSKISIQGFELTTRDLVSVLWGFTEFRALKWYFPSLKLFLGLSSPSLFPSLQAAVPPHLLPWQSILFLPYPSFPKSKFGNRQGSRYWTTPAPVFQTTRLISSKQKVEARQTSTEYIGWDSFFWEPELMY